MQSLLDTRGGVEDTRLDAGVQPEIRNGGGGGAVLGVWGRSPQSSKILCFFAKKLNFNAALIKNNAFKTWHRNWQRNMIQLVA